MLKTKHQTAHKTSGPEIDTTLVRAPLPRRPVGLNKGTVLLLVTIGLAPAVGVIWAFGEGVDVHDLGNQVGPYLMMAWPLLLGVGTYLWVKVLRAERKKTAEEWRKPLIAARSRIAAMEVVARARYQCPDGWPDDWPRDSIS